MKRHTKTPKKSPRKYKYTKEDEALKGLFGPVRYAEFIAKYKRKPTFSDYINKIQRPWQALCPTVKLPIIIHKE